MEFREYGSSSPQWDIHATPCEKMTNEVISSVFPEHSQLIPRDIHCMGWQEPISKGAVQGEGILPAFS
jgi:hypothetical protein